MPLSNILVHLDSSPRSATRLAIAVDLAARHGARLVGLFAEKTPALRVGLVASWPSPDYLAHVETAREAFAAASAALGEKAAFIDLNRGGEHEILARATDVARAFDLVILGQSEEHSRTPSELPEQIIVESGRPVLVIPNLGDFAHIGQRPMIAWRRSRSSARALFDALPLFADKAQAVVVQVDKHGDAPHEFVDLIVANLAAHGVDARFHHVVTEDVKVMDTLLNELSDLSSDMLVAGAFDHSGFPSLGRGSGSRYLLRHMTQPVLFSH
jgi:nucleotide-binding universal stress UspA family protein